MWFQRLNTISDTEPGRLEISVLYDENSDFQQEFAKLPESVRSEAQRVSALHSVAVGDVNQDGRVDVTDAVLLSKAVNGSVTVSDAQRETMDCDGDGDITANDVTTLMRFLDSPGNRTAAETVTLEPVFTSVYKCLFGKFLLA